MQGCVREKGDFSAARNLVVLSMTDGAKRERGSPASLSEHPCVFVGNVKKAMFAYTRPQVFKAV